MTMQPCIKCLPNFLIVGAHKSATTNIASRLRHHPQVFLPAIKEPHYFVYPEVRGRIPGCVETEHEYVRLFERGEGMLRRGEASVLYLYYHQQAIPRILELLGDNVAIIISLRNPIERAYSAYLDVRRGNARETLTFEHALDAEPERIDSGYGSPTMHYLAVGSYAAQVRNYLDIFQKVKIVLFDDFVSDPDAVITDISAFLRLPEVGASTVNAYESNRGGVVWRGGFMRNVALNPAVTAARRTVKKRVPVAYARLRDAAQLRFMRKAESMSSATLLRLREHYRAEIRTLGEMIDRDLTHWLR